MTSREQGDLSTALDLRAFISRLKGDDELRTVNGAHWDLEIGALTEIFAGEAKSPALLFDDIPGHPRGYRVFSNILNSHYREALALGISPEIKGMDLVKWIRERLTSLKTISPSEQKDGPVLENVLSGKDVNVLRFPTPKWHEGDGGRYIGTYDAVICRDPDTGYINLGTYRVQVHDERRVGLCIAPRKHGDLIAQKYWSKGESCPFLVVVGLPPALFLASSIGLPWQSGEYEFMGGFLGSPVPVITAPGTGLPMPASAEIVLEGFAPPPAQESMPEGPFGEWPGYYASDQGPAPVLKVETIYHRNDPILTGAPPLKTYLNEELFLHVRSANLWSALDRSGVPEVRGVWLPRQGRFLIVVAIKQQYPGHAQAAAHAVLGTRHGGRDTRIVIVVDEDIDITNINEVMWAVCSRWDPRTASEILDVEQTPLNPRLPPEKRARREWKDSCIVIDACRPFHWINEYPAVSAFSAEDRKKISDKWAHLFK